MRFYFLERDDGNCEVICTTCFRPVATIRAGDPIPESTTEHHCALAKRSEEESRHVHLSATKWRSGIRRELIAIGGTNPWATLFCITLLLYAMPNLVEWIVSQYAGALAGVVLLGDLAGCLYIAVVCGRAQLAIVLYVLMTIAEMLALELRMVSVTWLLCVTNFVPAVVALRLLQKVRAQVGSNQTGVWQQ